MWVSTFKHISSTLCISHQVFSRRWERVVEFSFAFPFSWKCFSFVLWWVYFLDKVNGSLDLFSYYLLWVWFISSVSLVYFFCVLLSIHTTGTFLITSCSFLMYEPDLLFWVCVVLFFLCMYNFLHFLFWRSQRYHEFTHVASFFKKKRRRKRTAEVNASKEGFVFLVTGCPDQLAPASTNSRGLNRA